LERRPSFPENAPPSKDQRSKEETTKRCTVTTITLPLPLRIGNVNSYAVETDCGYVLIDTGGSNSRTRIEEALRRVGCEPGSLELIILTHGDFDHIGNAAYIRAAFGGVIAMHYADAGMAERGDMFWNRQSGNAAIRVIARIFFRLSEPNRFTPDLYVEDGTDLSAFGIDARILSIPGHSKGSIGILTAAGDLFCGDLLENVRRPARKSIVDDAAECAASIERLSELRIRTVYPGHGKPFPMDQLSRDPGETNIRQG
jgi:glyoxylase-like metal-dependent hydrolase (beta-lactamase superfamily II)